MSRAKCVIVQLPQKYLIIYKKIVENDGNIMYNKIKTKKNKLKIKKQKLNKDMAGEFIKILNQW